MRCLAGVYCLYFNLSAKGVGRLSLRTGILDLMTREQGTLFDRRRYSGVIPQTYQIVPPTADQTILQTLPAYHAYLSSGAYSKYTPDDFASDVKRFGLYTQNKALRDIHTVDIQRWIEELRKTMAAKTVSRKVSALGNYFQWLKQEKVLGHNPAKTIRAPRITSPLPDILFDSDCQQLLSAASTDPRTYLLVLLLLETGLKKAELLDLKVIHFDFSNKYQPELWVKHVGKQVRKDRKLRLPPEIMLVFADYIERYDIADSLFPYTPRFIELLLASVAKQANIHKKVTAGILRDTFVVRSIKQGMKLEDVLKKIGLSDRTWDDAKNKYERLTSKGI
jgi:site-specific recombinase XerD